MANHDDLDSFFKKKDRKGKKQPTLVTNNEELLKKLAIVTSATTAFKENMDFDEEDEGESRRGITDENHREPVDENQCPPNQKAKLTSNPNPKQQPVTHIEYPSGDKPSSTQQDEWEDFVGTHERYNQLRMKLNPNLADDDQSNDDEDGDELNNGHDELNNHENHSNASKDKPVWKFQPTQSAVAEKPTETTPLEVKDETPVVKPAAVYRPPQMRTNAGQTGAVTIVSGVHQRTSKKEKPNIASTEDFPSLGKTVNKK